MVQGLRVSSVLVENLSLVPNTHTLDGSQPTVTTDPGEVDGHHF